MKISYNWLKNISLLFLLILPTENILAYMPCFRNNSEYNLFDIIGPILLLLAFAILIIMLRSQIKNNIIFYLVIVMSFGGLSMTLNLDVILKLSVFIILSVLTLTMLYVFKLMGGVSLGVAKKIAFAFIVLYFIFHIAAEPFEELTVSIKCSFTDGNLKKNQCGYLYCEQ